MVARRLSQCLNPTLPAGVHQKALEVYTYIFSLIGKAGLGRDLPYYLPGLSPVLAFASLSVKPHLLSLFDTFIVALDPVALRPALKAILLALLPGLEEESSDEFEQTLVILQRLKEAVAHGEHDGRSLQDASGHHFFWQSLFLAAITSPSRRQGALAYLQRHLPRLGKSAESRHRPNGQDGERTREFSGEVEAITSPEPGLLIRCFIAGLGDENVLTQRGFLDMLVTHLPLRSEALHRKVSPRDLIKLTSAAVSVVLRREMSLNRRLWTWFLGSKDQSADEASGPASPDDAQGHIETHGRRTEYFRQYGHTLLVEGLLQMFESDLATVAEKARPFRVALALMDRWEIGSLVIPHIFLPALKSIWSYQRVARTPEDFTEVLRSGKGFFDGVESGLIWDEISIKLLCATSMQSPDQEPFRESLDLIAFVIAHFELQEEEMLVRHIPFLALALLLKGTQHQEKERERTVAKRVLVLTGQLIDLIPGRALDIRTTEEPTRDIDYSALEAENHDFLVKMEEHYIERRGKTQSAATAIDSDTLGRLYLANILQAVRQQLRLNRLGPLFYPTISILDKICRKLPQSHLHDVTGLLSDAVEASGHITGVRLEDVTHFVSLLETIRVVLPSIQNDSRLRLILPNMVTALWPYLSPGRPKSNIEAVRCVWKVHSLSADKSLVESCVTSLMLRGLNRSDVSLDIEGARRFGILWSNSNAANASKRGAKVDRPRDEQILGRPLLLLLDSLEDTRTDLFVFTSGWLQSSMNVEVYDPSPMQSFPG